MVMKGSKGERARRAGERVRGIEKMLLAVEDWESGTCFHVSADFLSRRRYQVQLVTEAAT